MTAADTRPVHSDDSSSDSRPRSRASSYGFHDDDDTTSANVAEVFDAALHRDKANTNIHAQAGGDAAAFCPEKAHTGPKNSPYFSRRSMSRTSFEAGHLFVNAMFDSSSSAPGTSAADERDSWIQPSPADSCLSFGGMLSDPSRTAPMTPRSILMAQKLQLAHADAVLPQLSPRMPLHTTDLQTMPPLALDSQTETAHGSGFASTLHMSTAADNDAAIADDDVIGRRLEKEIRRMMIRTHLTDEAPELAGMNEGPQELKRIGDALLKCMNLRSKYMKHSLQNESANPRNASSWNIYPPPPQPAWRNYNEPADSVSVEFDMAQCAIPSADTCVFSMGDDGVYAVHESEEARSAGKPPLTSAPSIREFFVDLDYVLDAISDGPIKTWTYRRLRYLDARWQLYLLINEREETMQSKMVPHRDLYNVRK
ncbi:AMP deaminase, partial [Coemansia sp. Benny D115]